jgi:hypothetical protein
MLLPLMLPLMLLPAQDADVVETMLANYRAKTQADVHCRATAQGDEIVVCHRREFDRYRVPFVPAANAKNSVPLRTADLVKDYARPECGQRAVIAQCGPGFGVTVSTDGRSVHMVERERAP